MCGRYSLTNTDQLPLRFDVAEPVSIAADANVAPSQELPVIVEADGTRHVLRMRWGLIPNWSKGSGGEHYTMIKLTSLLEPYPAAEMDAYPVSTRVNNPAVKDPALLLPLA